MSLLKPLMYVGGTLATLVNLLPLPWCARLGWARFLYFLSVKTTGLFPSIWSFVESQNIAYKMGKQDASSYQSILQLQKVLEYSASCNIPIRRLRKILQEYESSQSSHTHLGTYIAHRLFDEETAERVLEISHSDSQTW